jgi:hypothetical protein
MAACDCERQCSMRRTFLRDRSRHTWKKRARSSSANGSMLSSENLRFPPRLGTLRIPLLRAGIGVRCLRVQGDNAQRKTPVTICIRCGSEHNEKYGDEPSIYCAPCLILKAQSTGSMQMIISGLWLGDWVAAAVFAGVRICVHEDVPLYAGEYRHRPYLVDFPKSKYDRSAKASTEKLDAIAAEMGLLIASNTPFIVHCRGGVERSPLAVAWYLRTVGLYSSLDGAYSHIEALRPVVARRYSWLKGAT